MMDTSGQCSFELPPAEPCFAKDFAAFQATVARRMEALRQRLARVFPARGPAVLEVGAGHGHFLASYAAAHPDQACFGIDLSAGRVRRANRKRERARLENLLFLQCEALEFLQCLPPGVLFDRTFALFPDPWPKTRHHKNRLISPAFLGALAARTARGGNLFFRTDHLPYFDQAQETVRTHADWQLREGAPWPFEEISVFQARAETYASLVAERVPAPPGDGRAPG